MFSNLAFKFFNSLFKIDIFFYKFVKMLLQFYKFALFKKCKYIRIFIYHMPQFFFTFIRATKFNTTIRINIKWSTIHYTFSNHYLFSSLWGLYTQECCILYINGRMQGNKKFLLCFLCKIYLYKNYTFLVLNFLVFWHYLKSFFFLNNANAYDTYQNKNVYVADVKRAY